MSHTKLSSPSLAAFQAEIKEAVPEIASLQTVAQPTRVLFRYGFRAEPDKSIRLDIVQRTDRYMDTEAFQSEVLASYYKSYSKEEHIPPDIALPMDTDLDGEADFEYFAALNEDGDWVWWYSDYKNKPERVELP